MRKPWSLFATLCGAVFLLLANALSSQAAPPGAAALPGLPLTAYSARIGSPVTVENLTVFPIYATADPDFAGAISLEHALEAGDAKVREVGEGDGGGASVGTLVIENNGSAPVLVLAGTVVKGGKQDRQIAQDFVVAAKETVGVEAFCVERGRWQQNRDGRNTGGKFTASGMLAPRKVRQAAQHDGDQGKVWDEVAKTNAKAKKSASSDTLMATLDAKDITAQRTKLATAASAALAKAPSSDAVMGMAYAIDGNVRGARWFATRQLFEQHRDKLLHSAAQEALMSEPAAKPKKVTAEHVRTVVDNVGKTSVKARKKRDKALNTNFYKKSGKAGASEARMVKKKKRRRKNARGEMEVAEEEEISEPMSVDVTLF